MAKKPRIVAELGRPETPEETAARKAENSRKHRANQTVVNLVLALVASLAIVLVLVLVVVRPTQPPRAAIDYAAVAAQEQPGVDEPLASPALPPEWTANAASIETGTDDITTWSIGFITPADQFIALRQGIDANPTWLANRLDKLTPTGTEMIDGVEWAVYDNRGSRDPGNLAYAMSTTSGSSSFALYGTAKTAEFLALATALSADLAGQAQ
ncbi:MAG: DUF4245 domain-containing protein [Microbacteriaceae bacterium]|nr:DUF4245 domain-containing protein [Microbacteriaceae bacterium]